MTPAASVKIDEKKSKESTVPQKSNKRSWIHKIKDNG